MNIADVFKRKQDKGELIKKEIIKAMEAKKKILLHDQYYIPSSYSVTISGNKDDLVLLTQLEFKKELLEVLNEYIRRKRYKIINNAELEIKFMSDPVIPESPDFNIVVKTIINSSKPESAGTEVGKGVPSMLESTTNILNKPPQLNGKPVIMNDNNVLILKINSNNTTKDITLSPGNYTFGRSKENNDYTLPDNNNVVSRQHFKISFIEGKAMLKDLKSTNGTMVNDSGVSPGVEVELKNGDIIKVADIRIKVLMAV
jgi:vacuolar-type H+-ATPase subunit H